MKTRAFVRKICEKMSTNPSSGMNYSNLFQPKT